MYFLTYPTFLARVVIIAVITHISTFRKEKLENFSDENVLLLTHCTSMEESPSVLIYEAIKELQSIFWHIKWLC